MALSTRGMLMLSSSIPSFCFKQKKATAGVIECSSRPQKKAKAHHMKTRPKKTQPWDVKRRGPTSYHPLPTLPPDWTLVSPSPPEYSEELRLQKQMMEEEEEEEEEEEAEIAVA